MGEDEHLVRAIELRNWVADSFAKAHAHNQIIQSRIEATRGQLSLFTIVSAIFFGFCYPDRGSRFVLCIYYPRLACPHFFLVTVITAYLTGFLFIINLRQSNILASLKAAVRLFYVFASAILVSLS